MEQANQKILIERYFRNELSSKELQQFQQQLEKDKAFAQAVTLEKDIIASIRVKEQQRFRQRLNKIHQEEIKETPVKPLFNRRWLIAASIAILLAVSFFLWTNTQTLSAQAIFAANYEKPSLSTTRTGVSNLSLTQIKAAYEDGNYIATIQLINDVLATNDDVQLALILGICQLESNQYQAAIQTFNSIEEKTGLADDAVWYLGLTHLKMGNIITARQQFTKLLDGTIPVTTKRKTKVEQMLEQLNQ